MRTDQGRYIGAALCVQPTSALPARSPLLSARLRDFPMTSLEPDWFTSPTATSRRPRPIPRQAHLPMLPRDQQCQSGIGSLEAGVRCIRPAIVLRRHPILLQCCRGEERGCRRLPTQAHAGRASAGALVPDAGLVSPRRPACMACTPVTPSGDGPQLWGWACRMRTPERRACAGPVARGRDGDVIHMYGARTAGRMAAYLAFLEWGYCGLGHTGDA